MLHAVAHRKHRSRIESADGCGYTGNEDLLTSAVFGLLSYLDEAALGQVLSALAPALEGRPFHLQAIKFWPRYPGVGRPGPVEPDVVLHFDGWILCVEAKRSDEAGKQKADQLIAQQLALASEHAGVLLHQLAIGGVRKPNEPIDGVDPQGGHLTVTTWEALARVVDACSAHPMRGANLRVLDDVATAMKIHGVYPVPVTCLDSLKPEHLGDSGFDAWEHSGWASIQACGLGPSAESGWINLK